MSSFLEELEHAKNRGTAILGEIVGYGMTSDAYHMTSPNSEGAVRAIRQALEMAEIEAEHIDYLNAHAAGGVEAITCLKAKALDLADTMLQ